MSSVCVGIVDYGVGNLPSVAGAVARVGGEPLVSASADVLARADKLVLPGVGAFGLGMGGLRERGLIDFLHQRVRELHVPVLGICLGAQLMTRGSDEFGDHAGLGWVEARVTRLQPGEAGLRVPHVGWNELQRSADSVLLEGVEEGALFYYVHSYGIVDAAPGLAAGHCVHGRQVFVAAFQQRNVYGTQFHPEKSQAAGLAVLENFVRRA